MQTASTKVLTHSFTQQESKEEHRGSTQTKEEKRAHYILYDYYKEIKKWKEKETHCRLKPKRIPLEYFCIVVFLCVCICPSAMEF